ncbi:protein of unknown function [Methylorubrum extorquens]|uniref:Uncharacterized protein n=1 Tax=Methylorubrum extorquens TaxID=408 RepID=A0A2N9ATW9_METEX|nr:protein of unknown function [Methylorubrum extorquens]
MRQLFLQPPLHRRVVEDALACLRHCHPPIEYGENLRRDGRRRKPGSVGLAPLGGSPHVAAETPGPAVDGAEASPY